jgi:hypothetical protein
VEQLAPVIAWIKQQRFWLACGIISLAMIGFYYLAAKKKTEERDSRMVKLDSIVRDITGITNTNAEGVDKEKAKAHPNEQTQVGMKSKIKVASKSALEAWKLRYDEQKAILVFPEEEIDHKETFEFFAKMTPAEDYRELNNRTMNRRYQNMLNKRVNNLAKIVGATWQHAEEDKNKDKVAAKGRDEKSEMSRPADGSGSFTPESGKGANQELGLNDDLVVWNETNQDLWKQKITEFRGVDEDQTSPSTYEALLLQEDLWLLETVFRIVAKVNEGADANDLAAVKKIDHILLGREAWLDQEKTEIAAPNIPVDNPLENKKKGKSKKKDPEMGKVVKNAKRDTGSVNRGVRSKKAQGFDFNANRDPSHGRYVNEDYYPVSFDVIAKGVTANTLTKEASLTVAKRVPVRVAVVMNEKRIGEFLAACANSALAFEVRLVRINRHTPGDGEFSLGNKSDGKPGSGSTGAGGNMRAPAAGGGVTAPSAGGGGGPGAGVGGDYEAAGSTRGSDRGSKSSALGAVDSRTNYDVMVEFYGIIKIYNPVKYTLFGEEDPGPANGGPEKPANNKKATAKPKAKP